VASFFACVIGNNPPLTRVKSMAKKTKDTTANFLDQSCMSMQIGMYEEEYMWLVPLLYFRSSPKRVSNTPNAPILSSNLHAMRNTTFLK
jgi:hypothetical protein